MSSGETAPGRENVNYRSACVPKVILLFAICGSPIWSRELFRDCCDSHLEIPPVSEKMKHSAIKPVSVWRAGQSGKSHIMIFKLIMVLSLAGMCMARCRQLSCVFKSTPTRWPLHCIDHDCHFCHWCLSSISSPLSSLFYAQNWKLESLRIIIMSQIWSCSNPPDFGTTSWLTTIATPVAFS